MKRSLKVTLGTVAVTAAVLLAGCRKESGDSIPAEGPADYAQTCVEDAGDGNVMRVEDEECDDDSSRVGARWFYSGWQHGGPAVGDKFNPAIGSFTKPSSGKISTVSRGGFGGRAATAGGGS